MPKVSEKSYQALQTELDEIMLKLQSSDLDVDEVVKLYERSLKLIAQLEKHLETAKNRVEQLKK